MQPSRPRVLILKHCVTRLKMSHQWLRRRSARTKIVPMTEPPTPPPCGDCGAPMLPARSRFGPFWRCSRSPTCPGVHGAHPDGRPLGVPADGATRLARKRAHEVFDGLWRRSLGDVGTRMPNALSPRNICYLWLSREIGIQRKDCHFARFDRVTCEHVLAVCSSPEAETSLLHFFANSTKTTRSATVESR